MMNWQQALKELATQSPDGNVHLVKVETDLKPQDVDRIFQPFASAVLSSGIRTFAFPTKLTASQFKNRYLEHIEE